jgi:Family of unknown function (DUF6152)
VLLYCLPGGGGLESRAEIIAQGSGIMKIKAAATIVTSLAILFLAVPLLAHHGVATYDMTKQVTVKGVVTDFQFINPHAEIYIEAKDEKGDKQHWIGEMTTPNMLSRRGWSKESLKAGDQVTVLGNPAKDGKLNMRVEKVTLSDGRVLDPNGSDYR